MIWRRLWLRSDQTVTDFHYALQLAFGWSDDHLNRFSHSRKGFWGISHRRSCLRRKSEQESLDGFQFRVGERFLYDYDFHDRSEHHIRLERILPIDPKKSDME
jgi:hypothetical protein